MNTFWLNDLSILFNKNHFLEVIPFSNMRFNNKLNAIFRVSIYYFIIMTLIKKNLNNSNISSNNNSGVDGCRLPSKNNPFMNPTFMDITSGNMEQSCSSYNNSVIRDLEKMYYNEGLYEDNFDIFGKEHSSRQFYTMPVNSIVNDQGSFANWCYSRPPTCKEGNGIQCSVNLASTQDVSGGLGGAPPGGGH